MANGIYIDDKTFKTFEELRLSKEIATRSVATGSFASFLGILPDPDPVLRNIGRDQSVYKDLLSDDQVGSGLIRRKNGVKKLNWDVDQGETGATRKEIKLCDLVIKTLSQHKCKIKDIISQSLNPIFWGYSVFEVIWKEINGKILPVKVQEKPRQWFGFDDDNNLFFKPNYGADKIYINGPQADPHMKYKFILLQNDPEYENPYGDKALSRCFWPVAFKRGGWRFFTIFVEKFGMPQVVGKQPRGADKDDTQEMLSQLSAMVQDAVAVIPDDSSVEIKNEGVSGASADIYSKYIEMCNASIDKAILTNTLSTEQQKKGGYSSSETGTEIEEDLADSDKDFTMELFNELFRMTVDLNIGSGRYPVFTVFEDEDVKDALAKRDTELKNQGVKFTKKYYTRKYNFEEDDIEIDDAPVDPSRAINIQQQPVEFASTPGAKVNDKQSLKDILNIDQLPDNLLQVAMEETLQPVFELAAKEKDPAKLKAKLVEIYPEMMDDQIIEHVQKVIFINALRGITEEQQET